MAPLIDIAFIKITLPGILYGIFSLGRDESKVSQKVESSGKYVVGCKTECETSRAARTLIGCCEANINPQSTQFSHITSTTGDLRCVA